MWVNLEIIEISTLYMGTTFLISKDCVHLNSLPVYGNQYWAGLTPNIDELAAKGTVYYRHYAAAPSTAMSVTAMLSGHYPYEFKDRKIYTDVRESEYKSIFNYYQELGYECHIIWDQLWMKMAYPYVREFGDESKLNIHNLYIAQKTGAGKDDDSTIVNNDELLEKTLSQIKDCLNSIDDSGAKIGETKVSLNL